VTWSLMLFLSFHWRRVYHSLLYDIIIVGS
jgi:hypothetical protein